ncbi:hypothetical protein LJPFL01_2245 [Lelliottia jeotgali]|nr:hypothetical protein LJPFL01_2245 [Lelliottia jeotgali]
MDYSKMSDQEINMAVAEILFPDRPVIESKSRPPSACITGNLPSKWVDYCNNPSDAWPIIAENHIGIAPYPNEAYAWSSRHGMASDLSEEDKNPLRAAMTVFLMMQESANVQDNPT